MQKHFFQYSKFIISVTILGVAVIAFGGCSFKEAIRQKYSSCETAKLSSSYAGKPSGVEAAADNGKPVNIENYYSDISINSKTSPSGNTAAKGMDIWNEPVFQRQFMGSYGILSAVEPEVTEIERGTLAQVLNLMSSDNPANAQALLEANVGPNSSAQFDFILGNLYFQADALDRAEKCYRKAVSKFPNFLRAYKNLAMVEVRNGYFKNAIGSLTKIMELGEGAALTFGLLGYAYTSVEDHVNAEFAYRQAMLMQPDFMDWRMGLARTLFKQEKYAESVSLLDQMILQEPDNADYWGLQANAYLGLGEILKAAQNYEYLRTQGKADGDTLSKLGDIYVKENMLDMATDAYVDALGKTSVNYFDIFPKNI